ncbi:MAG: efflux RND transporter permease subunit [Kiritimatiellae bacterium]|nr:efflux RND transporter permease subunit [Kiritimatiellia bacterium]
MKLGIRESIDRIRTFSRTFVERPRFAMVIAIVLTMAGAMAIFNLPVSQYPRITPPSISVNYNYPGANAKEVLNTVAMPLEDEVNGVDDMLYMTGQCGDDGSYSLNVTFEVESDRDMDQVKVENRVAQAEAKLPSEVKQLGKRVRAQNSDMLGFIAVQSPKGTMSRLQISDYCYANIQPVLLRIPGVGDATIYGPKLSMRVWLDPHRMAAQGMNTEEVMAAVSKQNIQASLGSVGSSPAQAHGAWTMSLLAKGRLMSPKEFDEIVVRRDANGGVVRLKDIARTEVGEQNYMFTGQLNGGNAVSIALQQKPGANAIATMKAIRKEMAKLKESFPEDLEWVIPYDATEYVSTCIDEIVFTLLITFGLVVIVCYLFLQDWRATLIPCLTIPVSLCSTFILMALLGYSINILTLFGLVLAIGVVVDDCIVVVERVQFLIETRGLNSKEATIQAMSDVTSAVIATTLVLLGIFVPVGFMSGITGRIYQQFSVTLSAAVCFSTVCALTLAPALCSLLLRAPEPYRHGPFAWFNAAVNAFKGLFVRVARWLASRLFLTFVLLALAVMFTVQMFTSTQTSFLPDEDQCVVFAAMEMPEGSTRDRTRDVSLRAVEMLLKEVPEVSSVLTITGMSMVGGRGENQCMLIVDLKKWGERAAPNQSAAAMEQRLQELLAKIPEPSWKVFRPPAIPGLGMMNGISVNILDKGTADPIRVEQVQNRLLAELNDKSKHPEILAAFSGYNAKTPHLRFNLDRTKAEMFKVPVATVYATLQNYLGSRYVNDVNLGTQVNRVTVQADWEGRATPEAVARLYVRSESGAMVPIGSLGTITRELGPRTVYTRDKYVTSQISVMPMPGVASGRVMDNLKKVFKEVLPADFGYDWAALSFQEARNEGGAAPLIALAVLFGYLFLVAQYESWTIPLPVMLSIFVAVFGALCGLRWFGVWMTGSPYPLSIYAQLGLVLLVGLASKNAILIVEFAKDKRENGGASIVDAAGMAAGERLRALLMTALTTLLGTLPMMIATGAGAASRNHLGTTEFWGMFASVAFGILLVPGLYALFQTWRERVKRFFAYLSATAARRRSLRTRRAG